MRREGGDWRREIVGGFTTFATMAYILFVNPAILGDPAGAGMDRGAVLAATALASAAATLAMGLFANYPIALAPGMGMNAFVSYTLCGAMGVPWQTALGMVFVSGVLFLVLAAVGAREKLLEAIPRSLQHGIAAGIGLFLAFIGLQHAGFVDRHPATIVTLGDLSRPSARLAAVGLAISLLLHVRKVPGALLWGILATGMLGWAFGILVPHGVVGPVPSLAPTFLQLDVAGVFTAAAVLPVFTLLFFAMLDTLGTLLAVGEQAGLLENGKLVRARRALLVDAGGAVVGSLLGTSTVTAYIESAAGVSQGARTWRSNVVVAALFLLALAFTPLFATIGGGVVDPSAEGRVFYPLTAPAILLVGSMMAGAMRRIDWDDAAEAVPAFLTMVFMPLTFSIADGLAIGFIAAALADLARPGGRRHSAAVHLLAILFALRFLWL